ncbi:MAG: hypothetical protein V7703_21180 [Hyphomicrobiales bacterium]
MSKTTWFKITLLAIWGASAVAALAGSFWLTQAEWVHAFRADANAKLMQQSGAGDLANTGPLREEVLRLRNAVKHLDNQNNILMSRLGVLEKDTGDFTANIPANQLSRGQISGEPRSQQMPGTLNKSLKQQEKLQSGGRVFTRIGPYPLKLQGTNRAPTDGEISRALKGQ